MSELILEISFKCNYVNQFYVCKKNKGLRFEYFFLNRQQMSDIFAILSVLKVLKTWSSELVGENSPWEFSHVITYTYAKSF